jgi:hypothetical protein
VPSHATFLTGLLPPQHGLRTNRPSRRIPRREDRTWATLAEALRGAGCRTGAFVSASVLRAEETGLDAGFETYDDVPPAKPGSLTESERRGEETVARALEWARGGRGPVFLWVHLFDPHAPYEAPPPWGAGPAHAADETGYDAEVAYADHCVGTLLDGLAKAGLGDAIVAIVADHGEGLGEHGEATHGLLLHEATLRVPLLLADPRGGVTPGLRRDVPVTTRDLAPTLLALAGVPVPEGMSRATLFPKEDDEARSPVLYAESLYGWDAFRWAQTFALRIGSWKFVDAGPEAFECDLGRDPGETAATRHDTAAAPDAATPGAPRSPRDAIDALHAAAKGPADASTSAPPSGMDGGGYWGGTGGTAAVLDAAENRRHPSPYARIGDLAVLDAGKALLGAGSAEEALRRFDEVGARDAGNPQAPFWRGRALATLRRFAEADQAYRKALDLGFLDPRCVEKALQASAQAALAGDAAAPARAAAFVEAARGKGVRDSCWTAIFEVPLWLQAGDPVRARAAHERSRAFPKTPETDRAIEANEALPGLR